ncbi:hypothetical protein GCM10010437_004680 [Actinoplanes palleronii]
MTLGIMTALPVEAAAVLSVVQDVTGFADPHDQNAYQVGLLPSSDPDRPHTVAVLMMPRDGTRLAATCCTNMLRTFPNIRTVLMAGIAGGVPRPAEPDRHVRLGDIVVATEGLIDYGHVRETDTGAVLRGRQSGGTLANRLLRAAGQLRLTEEQTGRRPWEEWLDPDRHEQAGRYPRPPADTDVLRTGDQVIPHPLPPEPAPAPGMPQIHYGAIGSADVLMKSERRRDELAGQHPDLRAVEMEGSGIAASTAANERSWFMVRGVADYAATGKNDRWHRYASYTAAVYLRALLAATPPLAAPRALVSGRALPLVPEPEQQALDALLIDVPPDVDLRAVWHAAVPDLPEPDREVFSTPGAVYHHLARYNARAGEPHPAFRFVDRLGRAMANSPTGRELRGWAAARAGLGHQAVDERDSPEDPATRAGKARPALVLRITVDGIDRTRCRITPFLQTTRGPWRPVPGPGEPVDVPRADLAAATAVLVGKAEEAWRDTADRADIEFVLPTALLNEAVQWYPGPEILGESKPIGIEYAVAVRSLERMRETRVHRAWGQRWRQLDRQPFTGRVFRGRGDPADLDDWATELISDDGYLVVVLSSPPGTEVGTGELRAALRAGVPIILWDQREPRPADGTQGLERLVAEPTGLLPENTRRIRIEAASDPAHFGRSVALLWDDADRPITERQADS